MMTLDDFFTEEAQAKFSSGDSEDDVSRFFLARRNDKQPIFLGRAVDVRDLVFEKDGRIQCFTVALIDTSPLTNESDDETNQA